MEKKLVYTLLSFFMSIHVLAGCSERIKEEEEEKPWKDVAVKNGNSLLWQIKKEGVKTSYIYGTMHMIESKYFNMPKPMVERIINSDAIIMEVGGMPDPITAMTMMQLDSGTVHQYFTDDQMRKLLEFMDVELGVSPEQFHKQFGPMKPFFILQNITQASFEGETQSYDLTIMQLAGENNIPLLGFETIEQQLGFFDVIADQAIVTMIMDGIEDLEDSRAEMQTLMKLYSKQKVDKFIPLMNKQSPEFMEYEDIFLYDRNKAWIPKIKSEIIDKQLFIAVGAAHLFGDGGVLDLLKKEGFTVTPISMDN